MNKEEWYVAHSSCPNCKGSNITVSTASVVDKNDGNFSDDVNTAKCKDCGWKGMVKQLVPGQEASNKPQTMKMALRTVDHVNEDGYDDVYISAEDMVAAIRSYGQSVINSLAGREDVIDFTESILTNILNVIISADMSHRVEREKKMQENNNAE